MHAQAVLGHALIKRNRSVDGDLEGSSPAQSGEAAALLAVALEAATKMRLQRYSEMIQALIDEEPQ
jgi:hypothetical protein